MNRNARLTKPKSTKDVIRLAMVDSALASARYARKLGMPEDKLVLSVKMSDVQDTVAVYQMLARRCNLVLHLGLTEAGSDREGLIASTAALAILLQEGIGDTIRFSLTPSPETPRTGEVEACRTLLQDLGLRYFSPKVISCPGCGRTASRLFQDLTRDVKAHIRQNLPEWQRLYPGVEHLKIAVMGCIVNGPGESRHADIGISLPGSSETAQAVVYADGKKIAAWKSDQLKNKFLTMLDTYVKQRFA